MLLQYLEAKYKLPTQNSEEPNFFLFYHFWAGEFVWSTGFQKLNICSRGCHVPDT